MRFMIMKEVYENANLDIKLINNIIFLILIITYDGVKAI